MTAMATRLAETTSTTHTQPPGVTTTTRRGRRRRRTLPSGQRAAWGAVLTRWVRTRRRTRRCGGCMDGSGQVSQPELPHHLLRHQAPPTTLHETEPLFCRWRRRRRRQPRGASGVPEADTGGGRCSSPDLHLGRCSGRGPSAAGRLGRRSRRRRRKRLARAPATLAAGTTRVAPFRLGSHSSQRICVTRTCSTRLCSASSLERRCSWTRSSACCCT